MRINRISPARRVRDAHSDKYKYEMSNFLISQMKQTRRLKQKKDDRFINLGGKKKKKIGSPAGEPESF